MQYQQTVRLARIVARQANLPIRQAHLAVCDVLVCRRPSRYRADVLLALAASDPDDAPLPTDAPGDDCPEHGPYDGSPGDCPHCQEEKP
jgi:hypothetical protein